MSTFEGGILHIDFAQREVALDGQPVHLHPKQYQVLVTLIRRQGQSVSIPELIAAVWGDDVPSGVGTTAIRAYVAGLRHKLTGHGRGDYSAIETVPDGYRYRSSS
jgi:two-component system, OmpR family, KDP operon response regulator KdpE